MANNQLYHLGPDIPGNINNFKIDKKNLFIDVPHPTDKEKCAKICYPYDSFLEWASENLDGASSDLEIIQKFVNGLISNAHEINIDQYHNQEDNEAETLFEIIDSDNNLIKGDEPINDKTKTGKSVKNSDVVVNQTMLRRNFYYPSYSIGWITW
jgi:hypothetical protein